LTLTLVREARDNVFFPSRGHRLMVTGHISGGILGGDTDVYGWELKGEQYFVLWADHVFGLRGRVEVCDEYGDTESVSVFDRLFAGGGRTIRGFGYRSVGPKVKRETGPEQFEYRTIGGRSLAVGSVEYIVPLVEKLKLALFVDAGNVSEDAYDFGFHTMAASAGLEFRVDVQQFPIRFNYAWILQKDDENTEEQPFGFWIGSGF
jgi:outer membrane protein assembly factor BamA